MVSLSIVKSDSRYLTAVFFFFFICRASMDYINFGRYKMDIQQAYQ